MTTLPKIGDKKTLAQKAYDAIKEAILLNKLKPGELLKEEELSESLAISRTPIRSALKELAFEDLVTINSSRNVVVSNITQEDIEELYVVREALEIATIISLEGNITEENIKVLEKILEKQEEAYNNDDFSEFIIYEFEFHSSLSDFTRNKWLIKMSNSVHTIVQRYLILSGSLKKYSVDAIKEHKSILQAIKQSDYKKAKDLTSEHISSVKERILK